MPSDPNRPFAIGSLIRHKTSGNVYVITSFTEDGFNMNGVNFMGQYHSRHRELDRWEHLPEERPVIARKKLGRRLDL